jgi:hypothetical protein
MHHLAGVGHLLGSVIQSPLSQWTYLQVRNVLLAMVDLLASLEACSSAEGGSTRLKAHIQRIDAYMTNAAREKQGSSKVYHNALPKEAWSNEQSLRSTVSVTLRPVRRRALMLVLVRYFLTRSAERTNSFRTAFKRYLYRPFHNPIPNPGGDRSGNTNGEGQAGTESSQRHDTNTGGGQGSGDGPGGGIQDILGVGFPEGFVGAGQIGGVLGSMGGFTSQADDGSRGPGAGVGLNKR